MLSPAALVPSRSVEGLVVSPVHPPDGARNRSWYERVGADWCWTDKLSWSEAEWDEYARRPELLTFVGLVDGEEIGYFELEVQTAGDVEIAIFGLLPEFIGRGLGGALLTFAVEKAWGVPGTARVWVHTCTDDHEHALANYERRGFRVFRVEG